MTTGAAIAAILVVTVITYASRAGLILFLADRPLPTDVTRPCATSVRPSCRR